MFGRVPGPRPNISESDGEISTRVPFCIVESIGEGCVCSRAASQRVTAAAVCANRRLGQKSDLFFGRRDRPKSRSRVCRRPCFVLCQVSASLDDCGQLFLSFSAHPKQNNRQFRPGVVSPSYFCGTSTVTSTVQVQRFPRLARREKRCTCTVPRTAPGQPSAAGLRGEEGREAGRRGGVMCARWLSAPFVSSASSKIAEASRQTSGMHGNTKGEGASASGSAPPSFV